MPLFHSLRLGFRFLTRTPGYYALSTATLALGIGAAALMFSVTESVLWRPLPLPRPEQLVKFSQSEIANPLIGESASTADFLDWRARARSFSGIAAVSWSSHAYTLTGTGERIRSLEASAGFFETLGVQPRLGRTFNRADEMSEAHPAILTNKFWRDHFAAAPDAVGRSFDLDREHYVIVGVLPETFRLIEVTSIDDPALFVPLSAADPRAGRTNRFLCVIGRLRPGVSQSAAAAEMHAIARQIAAENPRTNSGWDVRLQDLRESFTQYNRTILYLFFGFSVLVLVIASANTAGLGLVRAVGRQREYALRLALGAGAADLRHQALAEAFWLAAPGALAGTLLASWGVSGMRAIMPAGFLERADQISLDYRALAFVLLTSISVTVLVALAPAVFSAGRRIDAALRAGSKSVTTSPRTQLLLNGLIASEMALSVVLLVAAGLFLATNSRLQQEALGFDGRNLLTADIIAGAAHAGTPAQQLQLYTEALRRAQAIGGVRQAALASAAPLNGGEWIRYTVPGRSYARRDSAPQSLVRMVSPNFFELLGIRLLRGRAFSALDSAGAPRVAIVNENFANHAFPGENPIGKTIEVHSEDPAVVSGPLEIVGLAANIHELGIDEVRFEDILLPFAQSPRRSASLLMKYAGDSAPIAAALSTGLRDLDPDSALYHLRTFEEAMNNSFRGVRFRMSVVSVFAALAVLLAAVGIYGTIAFSVAQRTREFALRLALGAMPSSIRRTALGRTARLAFVAAAVGIVISLALGRMVRSALYLVPGQHGGVLYGVSVSDPFTFCAAAAILLAMALSASLIPASRAAAVDPGSELHHD
jgi:putative ABC transport system permease protein